MNYSILIDFCKIMPKKFSLLVAVISVLCSKAQGDLIVTNKPKQLAIESAQLAHQSHLYAQKSYFTKSKTNAAFYNDTAITFIQQSLFSIDSAIVLAPQTDTLALDYAHQAKKIAENTYSVLNNFNNSVKPKECSYLAMFLAANVTTDAYTASLYFNSKKSTQKIIEPEKKPTEKIITKLDIDQTLFTLLKTELSEKKEKNSNEIAQLTEQLFETTDANKQQKLKNKIKELDETNKAIAKKSVDTETKLNSISVMIEEREKQKAETKNETVFAKSKPLSQEWNSIITADDEYLPNGLVYQVQLGVYKNNVLPTLFKGLNPIYGKKTDIGINYSTGLFEKLSDAKEAKNYIVQMGLTDAFIIAYYNKKKVTIAEALKLESK